MYGLKIAKRHVRAKALIINAFALTGRIVFGGFLPQGGALGYVLLPLSGRTAVTFDTHYYIIYFCSAASLTGMARYRPLFFPDEPDTNR